MEHRKLGYTNIQVSAFSLGSWNTFEFMSETDGLQVMQAAVAGGINFLDDARYDDKSGKAPIKTGYSEVVFGNLLRAGKFKRDDLVISNRLWLEFYPDESFEAEVDASLKRIGIQFFDLVFCMAPPESITPDQLVDQLTALVASGKVRYWAPANWPVELLAQCCAIAVEKGAPLPPAAMIPFSINTRAFVEDDAMMTLCRNYGVSLVASYSLYGGVLTGKYNAPGAVASVRYETKQLQELRASGILEKVERFVDFAKQRGNSPAQLAYAYCLRHPQVASVLFGATSVAQVHENLLALPLSKTLTDADCAELEAIFPQ